MSKTAKKDPLKVVTSSHRVSYVHLNEPTSFEEGGKAKYDVTLLIPKNHPDVDKINEAIAQAYEANKEGHFKGKPLTHSKMWIPLRDGDEWLEDHPEAEEYRGMYFLRASSASQPTCFDADGNDIIDLTEIYSGSYCRASLRCFAFNNRSFGFGFYLNTLKKTADGERLGGFSATHDDFEDEEEDDYTPPAKKTAPPAPKSKVKTPQVIYEVCDATGKDIYSDDNGKNWYYVE